MNLKRDTTLAIVFFAAACAIWAGLLSEPLPLLFVSMFTGKIAADNQNQQMWDWVLEARVTDWLLVAVGIFQYRIYRRQTAILEAHRDLLERQFLATTRPKIRIKHIWLVENLAGGRPFSVNITYTNVGDGRAVIRHIGFDFNILQVGDSLPSNMRAADRIELRHPVCGLGETHETGTVRSFGLIPADRIGLINAGREILHCFGTIEYSDDTPRVENRKIRMTAFDRIFVPSPHHGLGAGRFALPDKIDPDYEYED